MTPNYQITPALRAELSSDEQTLTIHNDSLSDYDVYALKDCEWTLDFDSLSTKDESARSIWEDAKFAEWAD